MRVRSGPWRTPHVAVVVVASAMVLAGCGTANPAGSTGARTLVVGTTDKVYALDPAGAFDAGSGTVIGQVFATLLDHPAGSAGLQPNLAASAGFDAPTEYRVVLRPDLRFANGDPLTAADVKFSFDRQLKIASPNGPSSLLYNLADVAVANDTTVLFHLKTPNDQVFPQVLATGAGDIVDRAVFSATAVTPDATILAKDPFDGPYTLANYAAGQLAVFRTNPNYVGVLGAPRFGTVDLKFYASEDNLKLDLQRGDIDIASRTLSIPDIDALGKRHGLTVYHGAATGIQYIVFNYRTQPFGTGTGDPDPTKALAVRQAVADLVDRRLISDQVYRNTYQPLYTFLPDAVPGSSPVLKGRYGDGNGGPDAAKAAAVLRAAGIADTPVTLQLEYNTDHYGASSADEFTLVKSQLEASGLFQVNLQSTEWSQYSKQRVADAYPENELGWYADYLDAQDFFQPLYGTGGYVGNHYDDPALLALINRQATTAGDDARAALAGQIQQALAAQLPIVPLVQIPTTVVADDKVTGVPQALQTGSLPFGALGTGP